MNTPPRPRLGRLLSILALGAAAGCAISHAKDAGTLPLAPGAHVDERGFVEPPQKPGGSGVKVRLRMPGSIAPGETATVQLEFDHVVADTGATVQLRGSSSLLQIQVNGAAVTTPLQLVPGQVHPIDVQVSSSAAGMQYLYVYTQQAGRSSSLAIALHFGSGPVEHKAEGRMITTPSGERIISLPSN